MRRLMDLLATEKIEIPKWYESEVNMFELKVLTKEFFQTSKNFVIDNMLEEFKSLDLKDTEGISFKFPEDKNIWCEYFDKEHNAFVGMKIIRTDIQATIEVAFMENKRPYSIKYPIIRYFVGLQDNEIIVADIVYPDKPIDPIANMSFYLTEAEGAFRTLLTPMFLMLSNVENCEFVEINSKLKQAYFKKNKVYPKNYYTFNSN